MIHGSEVPRVSNLGLNSMINNFKFVYRSRNGDIPQFTNLVTTGMSHQAGMISHNRYASFQLGSNAQRYMSSDNRNSALGFFKVL